MNYQVTHVTTYHYSQPVPVGHNTAHLRLRSFARQHCLSHRLVVQPEPTVMESWVDFFGNHVQYFTLEEAHRELKITALSEVQIVPPDQGASSPSPPWELGRDALTPPRTPACLTALPFMHDSHYVRRNAQLADYAAVSFTPARPLLEAALDLTGRIYREFIFDPSATRVHTPIMEVFEKRRGVCQDFAHLQIACLRSLGLAARYVSGYLVTEPPPGQPKLMGADASHAWLSLFCPGLGWLDLDPTNNLIPSMHHLTLAWGRDYDDVCPMNGIFLGGGRQSMSVAVDVVPVIAAPPSE
jgi:transglutaminase-like putative cysteine protease